MLEMLDLVKESKRLNQFIKSDLLPADRLIEVDAYHAKEMLDRAITAEKALEIIRNTRFTNDCDKCVAFDYCDSLLDEVVNGGKTCHQVFIDWAMEKAREQG